MRANKREYKEWCDAADLCSAYASSFYSPESHRLHSRDAERIFGKRVAMKASMAVNAVLRFNMDWTDCHAEAEALIRHELKFWDDMRRPFATRR